MKILALVITYNPVYNNLVQNISTFIQYVDRLIIWDNSATSSLKSLLLDEKIDVINDGQNRGIAYPINQALNIVNSSNENYTHLLTMDQDSTWLNFSDYIRVIDIFCDNNTIFSPNINQEYSVSNCKTEVNHCITSGAIFSKNVLNKIATFNEEYSVDCVDYDFSFKARNNGVKIVKIAGVELIQNYGIERKHKLFGFKVNDYSSFRLYFIVRNHTFLFKDFPRNRSIIFYYNSFKNYFLFKIPKILLMEKDKFNKVFYLCLGFYHGLINDRSKRY